MKLSLHIFLASCLGAVAVSTAVAQKPQPSSGPLIRQPGKFCSWRIDFSHPEDKQKPAGRSPQFLPRGNNAMLPLPPRTITFIRTAPLWRAVTVNVSGHMLLQCSDGVNEFIQTSNMQYPGVAPRDVITGKRMDGMVDFSSGRFPDMDWISASTFIGMQAVHTYQCLVFTNGDMTAWVDNDSRFPVLWQRAGEVRKF